MSDDKKIIGFEEAAEKAKNLKEKAFKYHDCNVKEICMSEDEFDDLMIPIYNPSNEDFHRLPALAVSVQMYDLMFRMNVLDLPKNMKELKDKEEATGKDIKDNIIDDIYELAKRNLEFLKDKEG